MFNRKRKCINPDCREIFDPVHPAAECCKKSCNNRVNSLRKKGRKFGITDPDQLWNYVVMHCMKDQRRITMTGDEWEVLGIKFNAFPPPIPFQPGDAPSVLRLGNLGLWLIDEAKKIFKLVVEQKRKLK
jgi:hypothetical protein